MFTYWPALGKTLRYSLSLRFLRPRSLVFNLIMTLAFLLLRVIVAPVAFLGPLSSSSALKVLGGQIVQAWRCRCLLHLSRLSGAVPVN